MDPRTVDLGKLQSFLNNGWKIKSLNMQCMSPSCWRTTIVLTVAKQELVLQSDDDDVFGFCAKQKVSFDESGESAFRGIADLSRYQRELLLFASDFEGMRKSAVQRLTDGKIRLEFAPETLIRDFLKSRKWGEARFLSLKDQYFDILMVLTLSGKQAAPTAALS